jgi:DNA polymerase-4
MSNFQRHIIHLDLDAFFVSVECLKDASLKGIPIGVGGTSDRGVIASCSYEARKFGVRSAMSVRQAKKLCPQIRMVKGDMDSYASFSRLVTDIIKNEVPVFEKSSIDEFYIDLTGMDKYFGCSVFARSLINKVSKESGLPVSYALASNKLISKVATNEVKPKGGIEIPHGEEKTFLAPLPIEKLPMLGAKTSDVLRKQGIDTIKSLSEMPVESVINLLGKNGNSLWRKANGIDESPVIPFHEQKSIGTENTFHSDTFDTHFLKGELVRMGERVGFELRCSNMLTGCVTVKIKYADFEVTTRQTTIPFCASDHIIIETAKDLFDKLYDTSQPVRLVGVRVSHLVPGNYQIKLFDDTPEMIKLYQAVDSVKQQFGTGILKRAAAVSLPEYDAYYHSKQALK